MSSFPTANQATICPAKPVCQDGKFAKNKNQLTFFQQLLPQKQIRSSQLTEPLSPRLHISYMEGRVEFFHVTIVHNLGLPGLVRSNKDTQHNWSLFELRIFGAFTTVLENQHCVNRTSI